MFRGSSSTATAFRGLLTRQSQWRGISPHIVVSKLGIFPFMSVSTRPFYSTPRLMMMMMAKGKSKKGKVEEDNEIELPSTDTMIKAMEARIAYLKEDFSKIRGGQVTTDMFNHIKITGYEVPMTLSQAGQLSIRSGNTLVVNVYDPALMQHVSNSLRDCGMSFNPSIEGGAIVVSIPRSSAESRAEMAKLAAKSAEKVKQEIRHIRKTTLDEVKALKKGSIPEDDIKRLSKEVDALTEKEIEKVSKLLKEKEKDITAS